MWLFFSLSPLLPTSNEETEHFHFCWVLNLLERRQQKKKSPNLRKTDGNDPKCVLPGVFYAFYHLITTVRLTPVSVNPIIIIISNYLYLCPTWFILFCCVQGRVEGKQLDSHACAPFSRISVGRWAFHIYCSYQIDWFRCVYDPSLGHNA